MKYFIVLFFATIQLLANEITVTISFGNDKEDKVITTTYENGDTALDILNKVADIEVSKGKYKFIRSIDGQKSIPGTYGWFYLIDGEPTKKMASTYQLNDAFTMLWYYKVEDCY